MMDSCRLPFGLAPKQITMPSSKLSPDSSASARFATTHWSLVVAAGRRSSPQAREALATLCRAYWYPLYVFIRRQGFPAEDSQDLTQEFLARLLQKHFLAQVDQEKGKFRSFLLAACKHFLSNERDRSRAKKRGGGREAISIDVDDAEARYRLEPAHDLTPEKLFERRWVLTLLDQVLVMLRSELVHGGKENQFEYLKVFLTGDKNQASYREAAEKLGMSEGAAKVAAHRLRKRYRELLRMEIAKTLNEGDSIEDEIRELFEALGS
jgi:RNA polymerase sigma-70 factor (ECF subfamily)